MTAEVVEKVGGGGRGEMGGDLVANCQRLCHKHTGY